MKKFFCTWEPISRKFDMWGADSLGEFDQGASEHDLDTVGGLPLDEKIQQAVSDLKMKGIAATTVESPVFYDPWDTSKYVRTQFFKEI